MSDKDSPEDAANRQRSGVWVGQLEGLSVREPAEDAEGAIVEVHGSDELAAVEIDDEQFVEKLSELAAEVQLILDEVADNAE